MTEPPLDTDRKPLSLLAPLETNATVAVVIDGQWLKKPSSEGNAYWILVVDRTTLEVEYDVMWTEPDQAPPIPAKLDDPQYMLFVLTYALRSANVPSGEFYDFLVDNGAGPALQTVVQASNQIGCGVFSALGYVLVGQLGEGPPSGFVGIEQSLVLGGSGIFLALQLVGVEVDGQIIYTPSRL